MFAVVTISREILKGIVRKMDILHHKVYTVVWISILVNKEK